MGYGGNIITPEIILLIAIKFSITMYEVLINFPYIIQYGDIISTEWFVAFFLNLYIAEIASVFSDIVFGAMLLLARYFYLVDEILKALQMDIQNANKAGLSQMEIREYQRKLLRLLQLYRQMKRMVFEFAKCIEISILVQMLNTFANTLTNLYALLDFYVQENHLEEKDVVYVLMIFLNICLLLYAAEKVKHSSERLRDTLLDLDTTWDGVNSGWRSDVLAFKIWPEVFEVNVLGMFPLNNSFLLFLVSYAINFVVIILQFIITKALFLRYKF
ncbi:putative gustatory receptor 89a [Episyrphus balteatus]|uniref:putative gustatory receptor 89a n=1 Tax=Episyrphus balteatus TaxID=286459 RepID=UPI00248605A5|nr:putative gustatory receptor 89a [Episyrphus balteatus]